ncbi:MAG: hypothetical protein CMJ18_27230 [Phycisphaeraceae bacterium]|nr:hypothetical protein [Phycisphaeraceae bacterium]
MNALRDDLESARRTYESMRYPGNLAADVGLKRPRVWRRAALAAAAAIALAAPLLLDRTAPEPSGPPPERAVASKPRLPHFTAPSLPGGNVPPLAAPVRAPGLMSIPGLRGLYLSELSQQQESML